MAIETGCADNGIDPLQRFNLGRILPKNQKSSGWLSNCWNLTLDVIKTSQSFASGLRALPAIILDNGEGGTRG